MLPSRKLLLSAVAVAALAPATARAATTKAQYIAKADAICKANEIKLAPINKKIDAMNPTTVTQLAQFAKLSEQGLALDQQKLAAVRALPAPTADRGAITKLWASFGRLVTALSHEVHAINDLDATGISKYEKADTAAAASYVHLAKSYGLKVCGASSN